MTNSYNIDNLVSSLVENDYLFSKNMQNYNLENNFVDFNKYQPIFNELFNSKNSNLFNFYVNDKIFEDSDLIKFNLNNCNINKSLYQIYYNFSRKNEDLNLKNLQLNIDRLYEKSNDKFEKLIQIVQNKYEFYYNSLLKTDHNKNLIKRKNRTQVKINEKFKRDKLNHTCSFCFNNGEPKSVYTSHELYDNSGHIKKVVCPILRNYKCDLCNATGDNAHTRSYCKIAVFARKNFPDLDVVSKYSNMRILTKNFNTLDLD